MSDKTLKPGFQADFSGDSETIYRHPIARATLYTEGVRHMAEAGGAYWLLDKIAFEQTAPELQAQPWQSWTLNKHADNTADIVVDDGNDNVIKREKLAFTDFPLDSVVVWCIDNGDGTRTLLLPAEY